jgi:hypothetical protein
MIESVFSAEIKSKTASAPKAPSLNDIVINGNKAIISITIPLLGVDEAAVAGLAYMEVFYKATSMAGSTPAAERTAATPSMRVAITQEDAGKIKTIEIPNLNWGCDYFFRASVRSFG